MLCNVNLKTYLFNNVVCFKTSLAKSVIPKVYSAQVVRQFLNKSIFCASRIYFKWSAHQKSLGTTELSIQLAKYNISQVSFYLFKDNLIYICKFYLKDRS